ncbi:N-terminal binuclear Zn cluster-containing protein [Trichoderma longibrachiatum ATCC 18648]|uniref:N-terminal binuclear Zn cluster-containing protein n=1 Tax=Trichoderma longibrachiatum ATCC 18648 TaxID=983965 RepID=A0A2T4BYG0_TRILO|nr:N-terminal binuclear Zn cluster-containing protein [Trichoderma longibrachiatum ATCC 18648]
MDLDLTSRNSGGLTKKRTRILLSCAPCRNSKLKCDREQPCGQCAKKGRLDLCVYAPKPEKKRPAAKGMAARLKRLEGMVRGMMDEEGNIKRQPQAAGESAAPQLKGQVVHGENATTYVGATHCLAMLEDIEDIKAYFDDPGDSDDDAMPGDELDGPEMLLYSRGAPSNREDLLAQLPERKVADRLYVQFWQNPSEASLHWVALLFMVLSLGVFFNNFSAPDEVESDSPIPVKDRIRQYRSCAGWALIWGKYAQPTAVTIPAFILYVEADFILNRAAQMNCYILSGVCLRLMLKMGFHRDPSHLANISPFEGEMRRRQWNMAAQIDLLVSFHMGLPSMLSGIESDTELPRNLEDDDFDENCKELPPPRPDTVYTFMTYAIHKSRLLRVFRQIAQQAHSLTPPSYSEVLKLDNLLTETWNGVPSFMHVKPLEECVGEEPHQIIQRYGLASLYHKCRCVLHRRYLAEAVPKPEHDYSRNQCLDAAMALLDFQHASWVGCQPGNVLGRSGWFMTSLAVHDFMLAAMILYLIVQNDNYREDGTGFGTAGRQRAAPTKEELIGMIQRSHYISCRVFNKMTDLRKTADTLAVMLAKLGRPVERSSPGSSSTPYPPSGMDSSRSASSHVIPQEAVGYASEYPPSGLEGLFASSQSSSSSSSGPTPYSPGQAVTTTAADAGTIPGQSLTTAPLTSSINQFDMSWMLSVDNVDWRHLDASIGQNALDDSSASAPQSWIDRLPLDDVDMMTADIWNMPPGPGT